MNNLIPSLPFSKEEREPGDVWLELDLLYTFFHLFIYSFIYSLPIFSGSNFLIFMLMAASGGGRVLMTYLQWRS